MKAILVMFDSLNRHMLPPYGCDWTHAPNFRRLAEHSVTFDQCYAGSLPCMPARRELHTGRYNFLHRSWGPLEPFDDSMPELLKRHGVYTHLVSDHYHYWEDGGCTYHERYNSWEISRGQEGDPWKGDLTEAVVEMLQVLKLLEQTGDAVNQLMRLTYLTVAHRRLGAVEQVQQYADQSLLLATSLQVHNYIGVAEANLAWIEWHGGDVDHAISRCQTALTHMGTAYPVQWTARLPLLRMALDRLQIEQAIDHARALVDPVQQLLPDPVEPLLKQAICAWEAGQPETASLHLEQAVAHAQAARYL